MEREVGFREIILNPNIPVSPDNPRYVIPVGDLSPEEIQRIRLQECLQCPLFRRGGGRPNDCTGFDNWLTQTPPSPQPCAMITKPSITGAGIGGLRNPVFCPLPQFGARIDTAKPIDNGRPLPPRQTRAGWLKNDGTVVPYGKLFVDPGLFRGALIILPGC